MATVTSQLTFRVKSVETLTAAECPQSSAESERQLTAGSNVSRTRTIKDTTTPQSVDDSPLCKTVTITGGTTTIDFTTAPLNAGRSADMTGSKVVLAVLKADDDNTGAVTVAPGASNPYPLFGSGNEVDIPPGAIVPLILDPDAASPMPAVSSSVKTIDITGTTDDVLEVYIEFGT